MSSEPIQIPRVHPNRPGQVVDEKKCEWVLLPNQRFYLLPIVSRSQKFVPRFTESGVVLEVQQQDAEVGDLIQKFLELASTVEGNEVWIRTEDAIVDFLSLVRKLILTNYEYTNDELSSILTVTSEQMSQLFETMLKIILRQ